MRKAMSRCRLSVANAQWRAYLGTVRTVGEDQQATGTTAAPSFSTLSFPVLARVRAGARGEARRQVARYKIRFRSVCCPRACHSPPRQTLVPLPDDESLRSAAWLRYPLSTSLNAPGRHPRQGVRIRRAAAVACADPSGTCRDRHWSHILPSHRSSI
ncbi:hypothetical protein KC363_g95 [Hortaea werneckii]|nr:hypothetical protein KC363_g95 [Hortaea werneckii]